MTADDWFFYGAVFRAACDQIERRTIQISCKSIQRVRPVGPPVNTRCGARWGAKTGAAARTFDATGNGWGPVLRCGRHRARAAGFRTLVMSSIRHAAIVP